jgi:pilus assembly protein CpaE
VRLVVADADHVVLTRCAIELAGFSPEQAPTFESLEAVAATGAPVVAVLGPSFVNEHSLVRIGRLTTARPNLGVVLLLERLEMGVLQQALRSGVRDISTLDSGEGALFAAVERVCSVVTAQPAAAPSASGTAAAPLGRVIVAFSTKGGVGKSLVATSLSTGLAMRGHRTVIVDADLQFGDVAVLLGIPPTHTTIDAATTIEHADVEAMDGLLAVHPTTQLRVLPAPIEPGSAESISAETMLGIVDLLRQSHKFVVLDMPPHFDDVVLALIDAADDVLLVASMDIPSIKNLKVGLQTLDLLSLAGDKLRLVLNRANAKVNLELADVERALGMPAAFQIPSDIAVPQSVNRGTPVVLDRPKSPAALALGTIVDHFAGRAASADDAPKRRRRKG